LSMLTLYLESVLENFAMLSPKWMSKGRGNYKQFI